MQYTTWTLLALGLFGILIHMLMKIHTVNKRVKGDFRFNDFIRLEWPSIAISVCVVIVCLIAKVEVKQFDYIGNYIGLGFVAIGYMAQSIVYYFAGKAEKILDKKDEDNKP